VLELTAAGYRDVLAQMLGNGILAETAHESRLRGIAAPLERSGAVGATVLQAAEALRDAARDAAVAVRAAGLMDLAIAEMGRVRARMLLLEGHAALVASVEEIAGEQQALLHRTRERQAQILDSLIGD
jgi:hypothetical protein